MLVKIPDFDSYLIDTEKWLVLSTKTQQYVGTKTRYKHIMVGLINNSGKQVFFHLHRLIYTLFKGDIPKGHIVHHIDGDGFNNNPENLCCMPLGEHIKLHHTGLKMSESQNRKLHKLLSKPVLCFKDGVFIKEYQSISATESDGFNFTSVSNCCNGRQHSHKQHQFYFKQQ